MATSRQELEELHCLVARSYKTRIVQDLDDNIPTDAATLSGAVKFLKDNAITADPANTDDLDALRDQLKEAAAVRSKRAQNKALDSVLAATMSDLADAHG